MFLDAYRQGAFPMAELPGGILSGRPLPTARSIHWYRPDPRAILPLEDNALRVPRSIRRTLDRASFTLTSDHAFESVIRACARPGPSRGGAWLDESLVRVYTLLHETGHAHSVEAWLPKGGTDGSSASGEHPDAPEAMLIGGIYGLSIGSAFFAESMFTDLEHAGPAASGASSACLIALWHHLRACGYTLLDVQIANEHTLRFGVREIPLDDYLLRLGAAVDRPSHWRPLP